MDLDLVGWLSVTKDFRPISFTTFLLKALERLFDRFLKNGPLTEHT